MGNPQSSPSTERLRPNFSLRDTTAFPPFANLPHEDNEDEDYFVDPWNSPPKPRRHWCFFGEIISGIVYNNRLRLAIKDEVGTLFPVHFYTDDRGVGRENHFCKGTTFAAMYATQHNFKDGTVGIRVNEGDRVKVLPHSMTDLLEASDVLFEGRSAKYCMVCAVRKDESETKEVQVCEGCQVAPYCGEQCQSKDWSGSHQKLCPVAAALRWFALKDWENFDKHFDF